ncbi:MAG: PKD domain-containing protein [Methanoregulaceae archaeon]|nr:PKD domain-containing protein [Methanoregulaceae archaeon]
MICCCHQSRKNRIPGRTRAFPLAIAVFILIFVLIPSFSAAANNTTPATNNLGTDNLTTLQTTTVVTTVSPVAATPAVNQVKKPRIEFSASPLEGSAPLVVTFFPVFNASGGAPDYLLWDFGDGQQLNRSLTTSYEHTYLVAGTYSVSLTSANSGGSNLEVRPEYIRVLIPAATTAAVTTTMQPTTVVTQQTTVTTVATTPVRTPAPVQVVNNTTSGSGSATTNVTTQGTPQPCRYPNQTVANFNANPVTGPAPLKVNFTDNSSCAVPVEWQWDFGTPVNPGIKTLRDPLVTYTEPGNYTVTLTVRNAKGGNSSVTRKSLVHVLPPVTRTPYPTATTPATAAPVQVSADFIANVTSGESPLRVQFTDTSAGAPAVTWAWDFGDGSNSSIKNPMHVYSSPGTYSVSLKAVSANGTQSNKIKENYIQVRTPAAAIPFEVVIVVGVIIVLAVGAYLMFRGRASKGSHRTESHEPPKSPGRRRGGDL